MYVELIEDDGEFRYKVIDIIGKLYVIRKFCLIII